MKQELIQKSCEIAKERYAASAAIFRNGIAACLVCYRSYLDAENTGKNIETNYS